MSFSGKGPSMPQQQQQPPSPPLSDGHFLLQLLHNKKPISQNPQFPPPSSSSSYPLSPDFIDPAVAALGPSHPFFPVPSIPYDSPQTHFVKPHTHLYQHPQQPQFSVNPPPGFGLPFASEASLVEARNRLPEDRGVQSLVFGSMECEVRLQDGMSKQRNSHVGGFDDLSRNWWNGVNGDRGSLLGSPQILSGGLNSLASARPKFIDQRPDVGHFGNQGVNSNSQYENSVGGDSRNLMNLQYQKSNLENSQHSGKRVTAQWYLKAEKADEKHGDSSLEMNFSRIREHPSMTGFSETVQNGNIDLTERLKFAKMVERHDLDVKEGGIDSSVSNSGDAKEKGKSWKERERERQLECEKRGRTVVGRIDAPTKSTALEDGDGSIKVRDRHDNYGGKIFAQGPNNRRLYRKQLVYRSDLEIQTPHLLSIYESLVPLEEDRAKQNQLFSMLEKTVVKEWPGSQLHIYGSCANSFGVSKSDIDLCLSVDEGDISKLDILLRLSEILQSDNLQNVQALTHARVPIVKLMDPTTGISCDICVNNMLAVVNTKLLHDYAQIDVRLRQLAFIVKHWAKSRQVNETYRGTLSSYAYVLMCIHFLQLRRPAILPCLQQMEPTYNAVVDGVHCAYFDKIDKLKGFGLRNRETIGQLLCSFFHYWAYGHDYANSVISVRTASIISKREKDWTRRIGNDRHLICIEDPFETSHDLGRVVDKYSIKVLRGEFEKAADILQNDPNPIVELFKPYVADS